jgi:hypothetical protein
MLTHHGAVKQVQTLGAISLNFNLNNHSSEFLLLP